jgi:hypothetical protein
MKVGLSIRPSPSLYRLTYILWGPGNDALGHVLTGEQRPYLFRDSISGISSLDKLLATLDKLPGFLFDLYSPV